MEDYSDPVDVQQIADDHRKDQVVFFASEDKAETNTTRDDQTPPIDDDYTMPYEIKEIREGTWRFRQIYINTCLGLAWLTQITFLLKNMSNDILFRKRHSLIGFN